MHDCTKYVVNWVDASDASEKVKETAVGRYKIETNRRILRNE